MCSYVPVSRHRRNAPRGVRFPRGPIAVEWPLLRLPGRDDLLPRTSDLGCFVEGETPNFPRVVELVLVLPTPCTVRPELDVEDVVDRIESEPVSLERILDVAVQTGVT